MIDAGYDNKPKEVNPISLDELEKYLWGAAVLLRGQIDATSYKEYIFPLVFFKRLCDVFDEAYADAMVLSDGDDEYSKLDAEQRVATIPLGAHWNDVREVTENIGQALVTALTRIEQANPPIELYGRRIGGLSGIFGPKQIWTNKSNMPDRLISDLLEHFSQLNLSLAACPADEMGTGYEYLVGKFADDAGHTAQEFYTNRTVVDLMTRILKPQPGESIYDPTCGSGGMLIKCLTAVRDQGKEWRGMKVFGQELNALTASIARMNLFLHGVQEYSIVNGDTLSDPAFIQNGHLQRFDIVLANPPYSISQWNRAAFASDKYGRNDYGVPPQARADYAFIQHIICSLDPAKGRSAVLLPHGVLNRDEEASIRQAIVEDDVIEAIIGLGRNLFYNSGLESCVIIFNKNKPINRVGKILFVEAEKCTHKIKSQAYLFKEDIDKIMTAFETEDDIPGFSAIVDNSEILLNYGNLNIKLYVKSEEPTEDDSKDKVKSVLFELEAVQNCLSKSISGLLNVQNRPNPPMPSFPIDLLNKTNWIKVRLGDVASEYSERIDNPSESEYDDFIGSNCIEQYDFRIEKTSPASQVTSAQKKFCAGDYLLVRRSLYGSDFRERAPRAQFDGVCSADIITIRENPRLIADGYLINILYSKALWDFIVSKSTGGLTRRIKWKQLADFEFLLPPKDVQTKISHLLWASYDMKMSYRAMLSSVDEYVKSQFIEMFGDYHSNPKGWPVTSFEGFAKIDANMTTDYKKYADYPHIGVDSIEKGTGILSGYRTVKEDNVISGKYVFTPKHIIYSKIRPNLNKVALPDFDGVCSADAYPILPKDGICNRLYLAYLMRSNHFLEYILKFSARSSMPKVNREQINGYQAPLPPIKLQEDFSYIVGQADKSKFELKQAIEKIDKVMRALMQ